jgi:hypothetical protein
VRSWCARLAADLLELVLSFLQHFRENLPLVLLLRHRQPTAIVRYSDAKPFDIVWQVLDNLSLLCKLQRPLSENLPLLRVCRVSHGQMEPTNLGSKLFRGLHGGVHPLVNGVHNPARYPGILPLL